MMPTLLERPAEARDDHCGEPHLLSRFDVPRPSDHHVTRQRLLTLLDRGGDRPLTLVSAPAGSGKTALVAAWLAQRQSQEKVGWLTFEPGDDGPDTFWSLVVECLNHRGLTLPHHAVLTELCQALDGLDSPLTLVLDGCEVTDPRLARDLELVLAHSGRGLRLVMLTRVDPVLPLHRYRLEGMVTELRLADLAFTEDESAQLVEHAGVRLDARSLTTLVRRTRGWAAGLQFAASLLARSDDPDSVGGSAVVLAIGVVEAMRSCLVDDAITLGTGQIIEPLTAKEREVLGHLSELLSTQEIAATMFVSVNTVRTHVRSILRKLAVSRRNEAVRRARALNLIAA